jgi:NTP pyrophosphatase (non-canonical NTP hydrolase)
MSDKLTSINQLKERAKSIVIEREWQQFHSAKNICEALTIESAELLEIFLWSDNATAKERLEQKRELIGEEMADVLFWLLQLSWQHNIDLSEVFERKMQLNEKKYPVELSRGNTKKYTEL